MDRNRPVAGFRITLGGSLSARRAWIEMQVFQRIAKPFRVALRKESVDRNALWTALNRLLRSRSPQGERG